MMPVTQVFHLGVVVYYVVINHYIKENWNKQKDQVDVDPIIKSMKLYSIRYLTNWTFTLQALYFLYVLVEDILALFKGIEGIKRQMNRLKDYIFTVLVAPMALLVTVTFWSFWFVDREMIFPNKMDEVIPQWVNHALHSTTSVLALLEMYLCFHKYPKFKNALIGITMYLLVYSLCLIGTYFEGGVWLYPIFKLLDWPQRIIMFLAVYLLAITVYGSVYFLNKVVWGDKFSVKKVTKKKHKKH